MIKTERFYTNLAIINTGRPRAPYTIDGVHFMNDGQRKEAIAKNCHGLDWRIDGNTSYDKGSDIEQYNASVKSSKATLVNKKLGATLKESLDTYFQHTTSTSFWYVTTDNELVTIYKMDANTFRTFLETFAKLNERGYIRIARETRTMLYWLNHEAR